MEFRPYILFSLVAVALHVLVVSDIMKPLLLKVVCYNPLSIVQTGRLEEIVSTLDADVLVLTGTRSVCTSAGKERH